MDKTNQGVLLMMILVSSHVEWSSVSVATRLYLFSTASVVASINSFAQMTADNDTLSKLMLFENKDRSTVTKHCVFALPEPPWNVEQLQNALGSEEFVSSPLRISNGQRCIIPSSRMLNII